ncbi:MAG: serine hydrolase domain-containing protein [Gammaproteobacteria bacterium]
MKQLVGLGALSAALLAGCAATAPVVQEDPADVLARNLSYAQKQPGIADLQWRTPKEKVAGGASRTPLPRGEFVAPAAVQAAIDYSRSQQGQGLMIWHDGVLVASDFAEGFDATTPTATYSMHKSVVGLMALAAVEDGLLPSLDTPVGAVLPEWSNDARGQITLRQLLTHSSGLAHYPFTDPRAIALNYSAEIRAAAVAVERVGDADQQFDYNGFNSQVLGTALEAVLAKRGLRYADYLSERLWQPLGNRDAALWIEKPGGSARFPAGLEAGLGDWLSLGILLANNGRVGERQILTPESMAQLVAPSKTNPAYGLHLWRGEPWSAKRSYGPATALKVTHSAPYLSPDVIFFDGFGGQRVYVVPSQKLVVARVGEVNFAYDDSIVVNHLLRGLIEARAEEARRDYTAPAHQKVYLARLEELMKMFARGTGLDRYDPLIALDGAAQPFALPRAEAAWLDAATRRELDAYLSAANTSAFMIWHRDALVHEAYFGDATPTSALVSRSLAKPLGVMAIGRAIERGYIKSLDQPAADFLSSWQGTPKAAISIGQILQMRSGLAPQGGSPDPAAVSNRAYLHPFHTEVIVAEYPLETTPGTRYDYSNANAELVAPIIERATGRRYEQWLAREVLQPIGAAGGQIWVNRPGGTTHSGCCALLPAQSWLRLSLLLLNDGQWEGKRLLPEGFVKAMRTPTAQYPYAAMGTYVAGRYIERRGHANPDVNYRKSYHSEPYLADDLFLFDGSGNQVSYHIPSQDLVILRMGSAPPKGTEWDNAYLPNTVLRELARNAGAVLNAQPR